MGSGYHQEAVNRDIPSRRYVVYVVNAPHLSFVFLFDPLCPINNLSAMLGQVFLSRTSTKLGLMCHAQMTQHSGAGEA